MGPQQTRKRTTEKTKVRLNRVRRKGLKKIVKEEPKTKTTKKVHPMQKNQN